MTDHNSATPVNNYLISIVKLYVIRDVYVHWVEMEACNEKN